jgi:hypothetical protein
MGDRDLFGALQDDLVKHVLSFLPSRDAVNSAMLARRWRHLWRSTPAVRVKGSGDGFRLFVNSLLLHREVSSPLLTFEIESDLWIGEYDEGRALDYEYDPRDRGRPSRTSTYGSSTPCGHAVPARSLPTSKKIP